MNTHLRPLGLQFGKTYEITSVKVRPETGQDNPVERISDPEIRAEAASALYQLKRIRTRIPILSGWQGHR